MTRGRQVLVLLMALVPLLGGCLGYRLGTTLPPGIQSIYIPTFLNQTGEPGLETTTTQAAIQEFQQDGTLRIASEESADAYLDVQLQVFRLQPLSYEDDNSRAAEEYRLIIIAQVDFYRRKTDERLSRRLVRGEASFEPSGDLSLSKLDALPEASEDLARHIVKMVVEYW
ncbi:MAG: LptE family protein [Kiritimatiellia bacterium]|jgi:hypothetical protein|nr:LptE family protein [Kiritimatiellia bacterium]MDP6809315.1 LptE family protein [Kiritimatiellia bacterium]MDP7023053.1 LptE family protein [Kiritimatiellia bacterium]